LPGGFSATAHNPCQRPRVLTLAGGASFTVLAAFGSGFLQVRICFIISHFKQVNEEVQLGTFCDIAQTYYHISDISSRRAGLKIYLVFVCQMPKKLSILWPNAVLHEISHFPGWLQKFQFSHKRKLPIQSILYPQSMD
jgi:hypothetical protein